jgi:hypothetical protein
MKKLFSFAMICICATAFAQQTSVTTIVMSPLGEPGSPANRPACVPVKETFVGGRCIRWNVVCDNGYTWYGDKICDLACQIQYAYEQAMGLCVVGENENPDSGNPQPIKVKFDLRVLEGSSPEVLAQRPAMIEYTEFRLTETIVTTTEASIRYVFMPGTYIIRNSEMSLTYFYR